ncbi:LysR substrate-binding domain-containing protein [Micromonospora sp. NPDC005806]|uniref:LysR substrate-binding domain-containing protein n=1 Tax=Micromonospora sp. NPDC005806 TaxID=3364234 RepID=UPI00369EABBA
MLLEPAQLRLLALVERHRSLSAAATALGITPAAVTQQVARAERDCGAALVRRGPRGATLTAAGALLAAHGQVIDQHTREAADGLAALLGELSLRLRIGAFQAAALHLLPPALTALRHRHPDADLSVVDITSDLGMPAVAAGDLDLAVIASWDEPPAPPEHVRVHPLLTDPMVVVLPDDHPLAAAHPPDVALQLDQLRDEAWVTILAGHAARAQFDRAAAAAGFSPRVRFQTASYDVAQALVGTGIGVALVSRLALTNTPGTTHRELTPHGLHRRLSAATLADSSLTPLVGAFLQLLHDVANDVTATWAAR